MAVETLKNFMTASRKANMHRFHLFPQGLSLAWIDGAQYGQPTVFVHPTTLTGTMNGVNATFVLDAVTDTPALVRVFWNGVALAEDVGFTVAIDTITMQTGYIPESGDTLEVEVWI